MFLIGNKTADFQWYFSTFSNLRFLLSLPNMFYYLLLNMPLHMWFELIKKEEKQEANTQEKSLYINIFVKWPKKWGTL